MNIIMAVIGLVGLKRAPECIKMHHFEGEMPKFFWGGGHSPLPRPHPRRRLRRLHSSAFGTRPPPDHISGYGPAYCGAIKKITHLLRTLVYQIMSRIVCS